VVKKNLRGEDNGDIETAVEPETIKTGMEFTVSDCATMCEFTLVFVELPITQDIGIGDGVHFI
jgi:hypothetical protein